MPFIQRPHHPRRHRGNLSPPPVYPSPAPLLAPTILPNTVIPATLPTKLPPRTLSGHPLGTLLRVPTYGPLPTAAPIPVVINDPTLILPRPVPPVIARRHHGPARAPFIPGMQMAQPPRGLYGRAPLYRR